MSLKYLIFLNLLITTVKSTKTNTPEVYEKITEDESLLPENIRVTRHPKFHHLHTPPNFDFKSTTQQDPQRIRYAQQQQVDSYVRAYHEEQATKGPQKRRKTGRNPSIIPPEQFAKATHDTRPKSENRQTSPKQINLKRFPVEAITDHDQHPKKVDPVQLHKVPAIDNSPEESINSQKKIIPSREKASSKQKLGYQVSEEVLDQETEPSSKHESRVYFGQEEIFKTVKNYAAPLSPNYLAKPTYVLANPQLNQLSLDPKLLTEGFQYALPSNHQLSYAGFEPASKTDLEALNSLLGKPPDAQLQGLNELLTSQQGYAVSAPAIPIPKSSNVQLQGFNELLNHQQEYAASAPAIQTPETQPIVLQNVAVQQQAFLGVRDHTPIKEEVIDVANTQVKPNIQTTVSQSQVNIKSRTNVDHQLKLTREAKSIYEDHDDNVSNRSVKNQTKIKREIVEETNVTSDYLMYDDFPLNDENTTDYNYYDDIVTDDYLVELETTTMQSEIILNSENRRSYNHNTYKNHLTRYKPISKPEPKAEYGDKLQPKFPNVEEVLGKKTDATNVIVINNSNDNNNKGSNVEVGNKLNSAHSVKVPVKAGGGKIIKNVKITKAQKVQTKRRINRVSRKLKKLNNVLRKLQKKHIIA